MTRRDHLRAAAVAIARGAAFALTFPVVGVGLILALLAVPVPIALYQGLPAFAAILLSHPVGAIRPTRGDRLLEWGELRMSKDWGDDVVYRVLDWAFWPWDAIADSRLMR